MTVKMCAYKAIPAGVSAMPDESLFWRTGNHAASNTGLCVKPKEGVYMTKYFAWLLIHTSS